MAKMRQSCLDFAPFLFTPKKPGPEQLNKGVIREIQPTYNQENNKEKCKYQP